MGEGETNTVASITITGDVFCNATNVDYRLDTPSARAFLDLRHIAVADRP